MKRKGILSAILSCILCMSFLESAVFAYDDEHPEKYEFERVFRYDSTTGYYKTDGSYPDNGFVSYLLYQENIDALGGKLPTTRGQYFFMEDLTVTSGVTIVHDTVYYCHNGKTLTYDSTDPDAYMITATNAADVLIKPGEPATGPSLDVVGKIISKGSPIAKYDGAWYPYIENLTIDGGKNTSSDNPNLSDYEDDSSLVSVSRCTFDFRSCVIYNCAAQNGAVASVAYSDAYDAGGSIYFNSCTVYDCYAVNGGVAYNSYGEIEVSRSSFLNNYAKEKGGAVCVVDTAYLAVGNTKMSGNVSGTSQGGAVYVNRTTDQYKPGVDVNNGDDYITTNYGKDGEVNNIYLDCSRSNERHSIVNAVQFYSSSSAVNANIGISFNPSYQPKTVIYPTVPNSYNPHLESAPCVTMDDPGLTIERDSDGYFNIVPANSETAVKGLQATMRQGKLATRIYVYIDGDYDINDITLNYSTKNFSSKKAVKTYSGLTASVDTKYYPNYIYFTVDCDSAFLTEPVNYEIYNGDTKILEGSYKVADYLKTVSTAEYYGYNVRSLAEAILNYGSASQEYFNVNANDLNYSQYGLDEYSNMSASAFEYDEFEHGQGGNIFYFYGASLGLKENIYINYYFRLKDGVSYDGPCNITINGESVTVTYDSKNGYYIVKQKVSIFNFANTNTLVISYQNGNQLVEDFELNFSGYNYLYLHFTEHINDNPKLNKLLWFLHMYSNSAEGYLRYVMGGNQEN